MKKFMCLAVVALAMVSCGAKQAEAEAPKCNECPIDSIATEVLPAAAPSEENGGKVATDVIPAEPAN